MHKEHNSTLTTEESDHGEDYGEIFKKSQALMKYPKLPKSYSGGKGETST